MKTPKGEITRPVQRLHQIEIESEDSNSVGMRQESLTEPEVAPQEENDAQAPTSEVIDDVRLSRFGRVLKPVDRLNLS